MIELLTSLLLTDFSSGSSINYYNDRLYLIGDDANEILILDKEYQKQNTVQIFDYKEARIPKKVKADFETSSIVKSDNKDHLLVLGSASRDNRMGGLLLSLEDSHQRDFSTFSFADFISRINQLPIVELNLEGSTVIKNQLILSNRANSSNPNNTFIITSDNFWKHQHDASVTISKLILPSIDSEDGVSELCYVPEKDLLLITLSSEETTNAYDDGVIGDSYIGWIKEISRKLNSSELKMDGMINLSTSDSKFKGQKIEGICVESVNGEAMVIHLISDNDDGRSQLFKIKMTLQ